MSSNIPGASRATRLRSTAFKRDSLAAELERDPQHSTSKRLARSATLTSQLSHASTERELLTLKTTKYELEIKLREKLAIIEQLEQDRRWLSERETEEKDAKEKAIKDAEIDKRKAIEEIRNLRATLSAVREQHVDLQEAHSSHCLSTDQTISTQQTQITTLTNQLTALTARLEDVQRLADDRSTTIAALREQNDELTSTRGGTASATRDDENWGIIRDELHRQASHMQELELVNAKLNAELSTLRERHTSVEVLKEQKRGLEKKVRVLEELRARLVRAEAEVEAARKEREEWAQSTFTPASQTPVAQTNALAALRLTHAALLEEHGSTLALLRQHESQATLLQATNQELNTEVENLKAQLAQLNEDMGRKRRKWEAGEREAGFLRALLASYTAESTLDDEGNNSKSPGPENRVEHLEALLSEYKLMNLDLESEVVSLSGSNVKTEGKDRKSWKELNEHVSSLTSEKQALKQELHEAEKIVTQRADEIEQLEQRLFDLAGEVAGGRHLPPGVRVLSLHENPAQQWADTREEVLNRLRGENEALLQRLAAVGGGGGAVEENTAEEASAKVGTMVPRESWDLVNTEKKDLEELVRQKEKRLLRLQQVFTSKSAEFREAVASVLGLKLAFYPNGQVRVTSIFDLCASFVFQPMGKAAGGTESDGVKMQLIAQGEGGPQDLPQMMRYWIEEEACIPGFLASVTLECWDKMKREEKVAAMREAGAVL